MKKIRAGKASALAAAAVLACAALLALCASPSPCAPYDWDGGHDALGWSGPSGTAFFAEGTTRDGFEEYLLLRNPSEDVCAVTVRYLFPSSPAESQELSMPAWSATSICVNDVVGPGRDVSVSLEATPGIIAERQVYFNYKGVWTGGHVVRGVAEARDTWYFAEGTTRQGFKEWLCLQNPGGEAVTAAITYMLGTGETREKSVELPAHSRATLDVAEAVGAEQDVSALVEGTGPIIAERPMYFDYKGAWRGGHTSTGSSLLSGEWHFAEGTTRDGFEEWLTIMNPGQDTTAQVEFLFGSGDPVVKEYQLKAHSRTTVFVNEAAGPEKDVSIKVTTPGEVLCERPMYFRYHGGWEGGHDIVGATEGSRTWFFPTASVGAGFESWLCVANTGALENSVLVEIFGEGDDYNSLEANMAPRTRATFDVSTAAADIRNPWLKVSGTADLIAERPTYFSYSPKVEPEPFLIATWGGIEIMSPIRYCDTLGPQFHEASPDPGSFCPAMQPIGICLKNDNPAAIAPGISFSVGSDPAFFVEDTRSRGTYSTTACDVQAKAGSVVYAPVSGTVAAAESYMLYGRYPDLRVKIAIDGQPEFQMACLHMSQLLVSAGQRVEAGVTAIGIVRDLVPYFNSGPNPYTRDDGNHSHIQINHVAPGAGAEPASNVGFD